jgi:eukaryotic-like serine/threonine-protein kinase
MAQPFDPGKLQTTGDAVPIAEDVGTNGVVGSGFFSASPSGVLAYVSGGSATHLQLTWFDRSGKRLGSVGAVSSFNNWVRLSPDDSTAAAAISNGSSGDVWLFGLARGEQSRFTFGPGPNTAAVWSPDGKHIAFASTREGLLQVFQRALDRGADEVVNRALGNPPALTLPEDWSPDGRYLVERKVVPPDSLWIQPLFGDKKAYPFAAEAYNQRSARISPDGKWLAYASEESGPFEVYVQSFPAGGGKVQVSIKGGERPAWSRDGKELFFMNPESKVMAAAIHAGEKFEAGAPKALFDTNSGGSLSFNNGFDVSKDGRFLIPVRAEGAGATPLTVVVNWTAALGK